MPFVLCLSSFVASRLSHVARLLSKKHPQKSIETVSKITIFLKSLTFVWNFLSSDIPHVSNKCVPMGTQCVFLDFYL